jgi:integrase
MPTSSKLVHFAATLDLFPDASPGSVRGRMNDAFERWVRSRGDVGGFGRSRRALRPDSVEVYRDMWGRFTEWCVRHGVAFDAIDPRSLESFVDSLGRHHDVTRRYARRMLRLVDRIGTNEARIAGAPGNDGPQAVLARPRFRFGDGTDDPLPDFLTARETRRLVEFLTARRAEAAPTCWQDVRNRTAVGLQLGAGITPGEARGLRLGQVIVEGGRIRGEPWALALPDNGNFPARQAPLSRWAGRQLAAWLALRSRHGLPGPMVFPSTRSGTPWSKASATRAFQDVLARAGVVAPAGGSFKLRHTFALRQLTRHPPQDVARWLGIRDLSAIDRYRRVLVRPVEVV